MDEKSLTVADETRAIRMICTALNKLPAHAQMRVLDFVQHRYAYQQMPVSAHWTDPLATGPIRSLGNHEDATDGSR